MVSKEQVGGQSPLYWPTDQSFFDKGVFSTIIHKLRRHKKLKNFYPEFVRNKRPNVAIDLDQNASFEQNF